MVPSTRPSIVGMVATITAHAVATGAIQDEITDGYVITIAETYGVNVSDVSTFVGYTVSGSMVLDIPDDISQFELSDIVLTAVIETLGIHASDVNIDVNMDTGELSFTVTSESYIEASESAFYLETDAYVDEIIAAIETTLPDTTIRSFHVDDDIVAEIIFSVDVNDASEDPTAATFRIENLLDDFETEVDVSYITPGPSFVPSTTPSTSLPSHSPSITGSVAIIELSTVVNSSLEDSDISKIVSDVVSAFGVEEDDVIVEITYTSTGALVLNVTVDEESKDELEETFENEIASILGIHEGNIDVTIENGTAFYRISSSSAEGSAEFLTILGSENITQRINDAVEEEYGVEVTSMDTNPEIIAEVVVTVDTDNAENRLDDATNIIAGALAENGFDVLVESIIIFHFFCYRFVDC